MAAHIMTALQQMKQEHVLRGNPLVDWPGLQAQLDIVCWTSNLDLEDYNELHSIVQRKDFLGLVFWIGKATGKYRPEWIRLNCPGTKEQWDEQELFLSGMHE